MGITMAGNLGLGKLKREVEEVTPDALKAGADHVLEVSRREAPLLLDVKRANHREKSGTLRESGFTEVLDENTAVVGYRDFIAARQHEDMTYRHPDGKSKFLADPLRNESDEVMRIIADKLREALGK